jgi:hypothetical protein
MITLSLKKEEKWNLVEIAFLQEMSHLFYIPPWLTCPLCELLVFARAIQNANDGEMPLRTRWQRE